MLEEINTALRRYQQKWQSLVVERAEKAFFKGLVPVAAGWKVADTEAYDAAVAALRDHCDLVVHTKLNDRWIAKMILRDRVCNVPVIKIMQVRPGPVDPLGLDHLDLYAPKPLSEIEGILTKEGLKWTHEVNQDKGAYPWASVWFAGTEAKIKPDTVLDIYISHLTDANKHIKQGAW